MSKVVTSYRRSQLDGAKPAQILVLLLQTAVQRAHLAIRSCAPEHDAARGEAVRRLLDIVIELRSTLDKSAGGGIASNLDALYDFVITSVIEGHAARDADKLKRALDVLDVLRDAFTQAAQIVEADPEGTARAQAELEARRAATPEPVAPKAALEPIPLRTPVPAPRLSAARAPVAFRRYAAL